MPLKELIFVFYNILKARIILFEKAISISYIHPIQSNPIQSNYKGTSSNSTNVHHCTFHSHMQVGGNKISSLLFRLNHGVQLTSRSLLMILNKQSSKQLQLTQNTIKSMYMLSLNPFTQISSHIHLFLFLFLLLLLRIRIRISRGHAAGTQ